MARPTREQITQWLVEHGLTQVDPNQWLAGTFPEILRATVDAGRLAPRPELSFQQVNTFTTPNVVDTSFDISGANANQIRTISHMNIEILTANINTIIMQWNEGPIDTRIWQDAGSPLLTAGPYIGNDNEATRAWGAMGLDNINMYPPEMTGNVQRQLQIRLISGAPEIKTVRVSQTIVQYSAADWLPGQS